MVGVFIVNYYKLGRRLLSAYRVAGTVGGQGWGFHSPVGGVAGLSKGPERKHRAPINADDGENGHCGRHTPFVLPCLNSYSSPSNCER